MAHAFYASGIRIIWSPSGGLPNDISTVSHFRFNFNTPTFTNVSCIYLTSLVLLNFSNGGAICDVSKVSLRGTEQQCAVKKFDMIILSRRCFILSQRSRRFPPPVIFRSPSVLDQEIDSQLKTLKSLLLCSGQNIFFIQITSGVSEDCGNPFKILMEMPVYVS